VTKKIRMTNTLTKITMRWMSTDTEILIHATGYALLYNHVVSRGTSIFGTTLQFTTLKKLLTKAARVYVHRIILLPAGESPCLR